MARGLLPTSASLWLCVYDSIDTQLMGTVPFAAPARRQKLSSKPLEMRVGWLGRGRGLGADTDLSLSVQPRPSVICPSVICPSAHLCAAACPALHSLAARPAATPAHVQVSNWSTACARMPGRPTRSSGTCSTCNSAQESRLLGEFVRNLPWYGTSLQKKRHTCPSWSDHGYVPRRGLPPWTLAVRPTPAAMSPFRLRQTFRANVSSRGINIRPAAASRPVQPGKPWQTTPSSAPRPEQSRPEQQRSVDAAAAVARIEAPGAPLGDGENVFQEIFQLLDSYMEGRPIVDATLKQSAGKSGNTAGALMMALVQLLKNRQQLAMDTAAENARHLQQLDELRQELESTKKELRVVRGDVRSKKPKRTLLELMTALMRRET
eukprot:364426-Chlamydomonas_euryale.AAC.22